MKLAHLLLVHTNPSQVERLVKRLMYTETDIYIHLVKKSNRKEFIRLESIPNVFFITRRIKVIWGNYSMVEATLQSMKQILDAPQVYSHINLLSGQDYPLKNAGEIQKFFFSNTGKTFMKSLSIYDNWTEAVLRLKTYHFDNSYPFKYKIQFLLNKILPKKQLPNNLNAYGLSQWFTITPEHAQYVIDYLTEHKSVKRFFAMTWGADELVFQTVLLNSRWKDNIVNDYLRHINFPKGKASPRIFTMKDSEELRISNRFYARKFDTVIDSNILDYLDACIDKLEKT